ncbi:indolepyruvate ferredoxin oxidoreductase family protein [Mycobacterium intracellulare]|uniref:Indolepyruvate ferredoxin oxidoreductase family protein n=1 Tax=Mycobacterium intracellulare TaxID=1767 RepID=A0AAE4RAG2_MYCIT|nr:indolepyruvate ferredoxin oxidoreductase family protein [Mycobacterium intracellulare]MDV6976893.1 indolepyruvate ferredoxin oxidoreductase family protein [Mycobacterium intracellulare]MDV6982190.1 indolepyruvate ferredoxin oxidoreductase family protein [Mycobacterium intracellulare]MDV7012025.1 indolepyruvate ferredoxin oxidoreductase family protein [Mycobacterium intracellulare]MDV7026961.1 indolepyruvate ferredoxin oxidoreductase family protein [Mycobacterium intracellulare]
MTLTDLYTAGPDPDLNARYRPSSGPVLLTGVQAIARLMVEQHERDARNGHHVATFVSGYQGSPLGGLDQLLASLPNLESEHHVYLVPGVNEELAATSVWGSQNDLPRGSRSYDGVIGVWYGKGPGLDRASDALRHGAMYGANPAGGALALVGDDPGAKSSSLPVASERSLAALSMPILFPRNAEEVIRFGMYGIALSRASGCWAAMKIVADVADGLWTLDRDFSDFDITVPTIEWDGRPWTYRQRICAAPPDSLLAEADLYGPRWAMVRAFNAANDLDRIEVDPAQAWLGIVAVGTAYDTVREALVDLGLTDPDLTRSGIRILRIGMPYPLDPQIVSRLADGVERILVVEDKSAFVETQVKDILYGRRAAPEILGKKASNGSTLIPPDGELTTARLLVPLRAVLKERVALAPAPPPTLDLTVLPSTRTAYFCSGCPHNRSTAVPDGSLAGGGIGCHTLVTMSSRTDSAVTALTQMGGEGAQWIGQAMFTDVRHIFQNIGDGTYFHSGQLAVQACVAAGVNITYKILYNSAVAMTGAQDVAAGLTVPELTHKLIADGVSKVIVCADEPERHKGAVFADGVLLWPRDRLDEAQRLLRDTQGVTALIYDQQCAAEARRKRKRGMLPPRRTRVVINEAVCEGCGDCGVKSNCLSVQPVETELGRKTRIDQSTCNTDYSCLDGNCPSFVTVEMPATKGPSTEIERPIPPYAPDPEVAPISGVYNVFLAGIGGTGIVTVNQVLAMAALRTGFYAEGLDQTGLSQKAGPVTSHLRLSTEAVPSSNRISAGAADCILAFDLLTAVDSQNLRYSNPVRTVAVASTSRTPTGDMVYDAAVEHPSDDSLLSRLKVRTRSLVSFDALAAAERLFGNTTTANFLLVGAAYQLGALPVTAAAIEDAISINGVAVQMNQAAFRWGRVAVANPAEFRTATADPADDPTPQVPSHLFTTSTVTGAVRELLERRAADLVAYQDDHTAARLINLTQRAWDQEREITDRTDLSEAITRNFFKLIAYKDEYEVARMLTDPVFLASVRSQVPGGENLTFKLHPPILKALGRKKKISMGPRTHVALRLLAKAKRLRGTPLDPFGYTEMRRLERRLITHYEATINDLLRSLTRDSYEWALAVASAPDLIRGYEEVKVRNLGAYLARLDELGIATDALPLT